MPDEPKRDPDLDVIASNLWWAGVGLKVFGIFLVGCSAASYGLALLTMEWRPGPTDLFGIVLGPLLAELGWAFSEAAKSFRRLVESGEAGATVPVSFLTDLSRKVVSPAWQGSCLAILGVVIGFGMFLAFVIAWAILGASPIG